MLRHPSTQYMNLNVTEARHPETGRPGVVIASSDANIHFLFTNSETLEGLAKRISQYAVWLRREQRAYKGPLTAPSLERKVDRMIRAGALKV